MCMEEMGRLEKNIYTHLKYIFSALVIVLISHSELISSSVSAVLGSIKGEIDEATR